MDEGLLDRLYRQAKADRWKVTRPRFAAALTASARHAPGGDARSVERFLQALHLEDLALACACADGDEEAWDQFVREQRPFLYRAADAIAPGGGARDLADSLYAELYGLRERDGERQSLFRYFHGRSSLTTWLRAVLAQRYVDRVRSQRRSEPLPEDESSAALPSAAPPPDPECRRYAALIRRVLLQVVALLAPRDRLRLACYYAQELTLAQTGRVLAEHEATVSRQLARTRKAIRQDVEGVLTNEHHLSDAEISRAFECATDDAGPLDVRQLLAPEDERKNRDARSFQVRGSGL